MYPLFAQAAEDPERFILPDSVQKAKLAQTIDKVAHLDVEQFLTNVVSELVWVVFKIAIAILIYVAGRWVIRRVLAMLDGLFERRQVDLSLRSFLRNLAMVVLYIMLFLTIIPFLGINVTSIVALLASAGLAIGMALSGTMQNFAGGVMILLLKPYRVGDYISAQGQSGTVEEIQLFSTKILTTDRRTIYVPNSAISTSIIDNYSRSETRRVDWTVGISYGDSVDAARQAIRTILASDARVLEDPEPEVWVSALADSAVTIAVRAWVANADYWGVFFGINERLYKELPEAGVHFPFPQMDVHVVSNNK